MLRKGEEIIITFVPLILFFMVVTIVFKILGLDDINFGFYEWSITLICYVVTYVLGYLLVLRSWHRSYLIPYVFGFVFFIYYFPTRTLIDSADNLASKVPIVLIDILLLVVYSKVRKFLFEKCGYSELEYHRKDK